MKILQLQPEAGSCVWSAHGILAPTATNRFVLHKCTITIYNIFLSNFTTHQTWRDWRILHPDQKRFHGAKVHGAKVQGFSPN